MEAESVSYAVCQYYGIQTAENSFGYIAGWSKDKTLPELRESLETINKTAGTLISSIDRHFEDICKEKGLLTKAGERYRQIPNENSHNELDRSLLQDTADGTILGAGRTERCQAEAEALNSGKKTPESVREALAAEAGRWHCYIIPDLMTWNSQASVQAPVGRIDYLGSDGQTGESVDYTDPEKFRADLEEATFSGVPMAVVLYKNEENKTIPAEFLYHLDPPPKKLLTEPAPTIQSMKRTDLELYDSYQEAEARFLTLRQEAYNAQSVENPQTGVPFARLTFGVQREDPPGAADLLHVRNGQNYLVEDFTRMESLRTSPEVMDILHRMEEDIGFDRVLRHEQGSTGRYLPPADIPFSEWDNLYFGPRQESLLLVDAAAYLYVQSCATGYDYTIYDATDGRILDGGSLERPECSMTEIQREIIRSQGMAGGKVQPMGLDILEDLQPSYNALGTPFERSDQADRWDRQPHQERLQWVSDDDRRESVLLQLRAQSIQTAHRPKQKRTQGRER